MTPTMRLQVITPDKLVLDTHVDSIRILLPDGWWGILPNHAPMISYISDGVVHYQKEDHTRYVAVYEGTVEVQQNAEKETRVLLLTAAAEEDQDLPVALAALEGQASKLAQLSKEANLEFNQLRLSLEKSIQDAQLKG